MSDLVSVIIPTYKGSETIIDLFNEINDLFKDLNFEVVIVNDDSPDDSHSKLIDLQKQNSKIITYIKLAKNFGEYNAAMAGLRNCKGDIAVIIDDDFQHQPKEVLKLIHYALNSNSEKCYLRYSLFKISFQFCIPTLNLHITFTFYISKLHPFLSSFIIVLLSCFPNV